MKVLQHFFLLLLLVPVSFFAQQNLETEPELFKNTIEGQFEKLYKKSNNYREFKVVEKTKLVDLKKSTIDSLNSLKATITSNAGLIGNQKNKIEELNQSLTILNTDLAKVNEEKNDINFLGISFSKDGFKKLVWAIFIGLLILLGVFIYKLQKSLKDTKLAITNLKDLETEYEDHRRRALEREQIVMRKLQDEINKHKK